MFSLPFLSLPRRAIDRKLHRAIIDGDEPRALACLEQNADSNSRDRDGFSALEMARLLGRDRVSTKIAGPVQHQIKLQGVDDPYPRLISLEQFEEHFGVRYLSHLRFDSYLTFKRASRQCPWLLKYTALGTEHLWLGSWHAHERAAGHVADLSIRWIDETLGYGIFAERRIEPYTHIGEYTGVVKQWKMFQQNQNPYCFRYPSGAFKFRIYMVDAQEEGNETRFVNHSDSPNCEPVTALDRGLLHIFFRSTRVIEYGEQLCIDYGKDYWQRRRKHEVS
jgi:hypothetical protein